MTWDIGRDTAWWGIIVASTLHQQLCNFACQSLVSLQSPVDCFKIVKLNTNLLVCGRFILVHCNKVLCAFPSNGILQQVDNPQTGPSSSHLHPAAPSSSPTSNSFAQHYRFLSNTKVGSSLKSIWGMGFWAREPKSNDCKSLWQQNEGKKKQRQI